MKKYLFIGTLVLLLFSCVVGNENKLSYNSSSSLIGKWCSIHKNHPKIVFREDSLATLSSRHDTVYIYRYSVKGSTLFLIEPKGKTKTIKIVSFKKENLVIESLLGYGMRQTYFRCLD